MRRHIDIPESGLDKIALNSQPSPDINQFFGLFADTLEDGVSFQNRVRSEWQVSRETAFPEESSPRFP